MSQRLKTPLPTSNPPTSNYPPTPATPPSPPPGGGCITTLPTPHTQAPHLHILLQHQVKGGEEGVLKLCDVG